MSIIHKISNVYINQSKKSNQLKIFNRISYGLVRDTDNSKFIKKTNKFFDNIEKHVARIIGEKK